MTTQSEQQLGENNVKLLKEQMFQDLQQTKQFRDQMTDKLFGLQTQTIYNRLDYHKHITTIVVAILGFAVIMLGQPDRIYFPYLLTSIIIFSTLLVLILSSIRESLDQDTNGLAAQHAEYQGILNKKIEILYNYLQQDNPDWGNYVKEIKETPLVKDFAKKADLLEQTNLSKNKKLNYFGELVIAFFITGVLFTILALLKISLPVHILILSIIVIFIISFCNISQIITSLFNDVIHYVKSLNSKDKK